jgi:hypothetical protein
MMIKKTNGLGLGRVLLAVLVLMGIGEAVFAVDLDGKIADGEYADSLVFANGEFVLFWSLDQEAAHFAIRARTAGWVALGIEPIQAMDQADMVFGWVSDDGTVNALDCFSTGLFGPHPQDEELGGTADLLGFAGSEQDGVTSFEFSRPLDSGDSYDKPLSSEGEVKIIWALGNSDNNQAPHIRRGGGTLTLTGKPEGTQPASRAASRAGRGQRLDRYSLLYPVHAILMGTAFVLLFVGMFFPRYFKGKKWWLKTHRRIGIAGGVIGVVGVALAVYMISQTTRIHLRVLHSYIGLITIVSMIFMPLLGHFMLKIRGNPARAKQARAVHRWVGRATLLFMAATIVMGLLQAGIL